MNNGPKRRKRRRRSMRWLAGGIDHTTSLAVFGDATKRRPNLWVRMVLTVCSQTIFVTGILFCACMEK
jgi:hypothetical protein